MSYSVPHLLLPLLEKFTLIDALLQILVNDVEKCSAASSKTLKICVAPELCILHTVYIFCLKI